MNTRNQTQLWAAVLSCVFVLDLHAQILQPAPRPPSNPPGTLTPPNPQNPPIQPQPADSPTAQPDPNAQQNERASQPNPYSRQGIQRPDSLDPPGTLQPGEQPRESTDLNNDRTAAQAVNSQQNFSRADNDQDQAVSRDEFRKYGSDSESGMSFEELDQNSDGTVSGDEWASYRDIDGDDPTDTE